MLHRHDDVRDDREIRPIPMCIKPLSLHASFVVDGGQEAIELTDLPTVEVYCPAHVLQMLLTFEFGKMPAVFVKLRFVGVLQIRRICPGKVPKGSNCHEHFSGPVLKESRKENLKA